MLDVRRVWKTYPQPAGRRVDALRDVNLSLAPGQAAVCAGPEGAGKSTLLRLVWGDERPSRGSVTVAGQDVVRASTSRLARLRRQLGIVPEGEPLLSDRTAFGNVVFALRAIGIPRDEARDRAVRTLREVGLGGEMTRLPAHLAAGGRRRLLMARALATAPRLLVVDEPAGASTFEGGDVASLLRRRVAEGLTLLVATRHASAAHALAARLFRLEDGRLVEATGPA